MWIKTLLPPLALSGLLLLGACNGEPARDEAPTNSITVESDEMITPANVAEPGNVASNVTEAAAPAVNLAPDALSLVLENGSTRQATFGLPRDTVIQMITAALGSPIEQGDNQECGAGPLSFANFRGGLSLYFQDGKFAGWDVDGRDGGSFATANGVGIGATRKQLEDAGDVTVEESSLGIEFMAGGISGLLDARTPEGRVTNLWAGVTCIAR